MKHIHSLLLVALIVPFGCTSNSSPSATKYEAPVERERARVTELKAAPTSQPMDPTIAKIRDEGLNRSQVMDTLSYLCDVIGPRLTASPGERRATIWARDRLASWGLSNAHLHAWGPFGRGWEVKRFSMQVASPTSFNVNAYPKAWSPGLDGPIEAPVTFVDARNERDLEQYKGKLKGHIVLLGQPREVEARFEPLATRVTDERLEELANAQPGTNAGPGAALGQQQPRTETAAERRAQFAETPVGQAMSDRNCGDRAGARGRASRGDGADADRGSTTQPATQPTTRPGGGRGRGQAFSSRLLQFAQQEGAVLALTPSTRGDGGTFFVSQASIPGEGVRTRGGGATQPSGATPTTNPVADATPTTNPANPAATPTTGPTTTTAARPRVWSVDPPKIIPQAMVAVEDYNRMIRMLKKDQQLTMAVDFAVQFYSDDLKSYNVIAEIPGTDLKDEIVMVGAHIDSWHSATGATDNAAGTACAMEAVRIIKALNLQPRRTIRVALWTGEEQGLMGSAAYVKEFLGSDPDAAARREAIRRAFQEAAEAGDPTSQPTTPPPAIARTIKKEKDYEKLSVYFNLDNGTGKIRGIYTQGNEAAMPIFKEWLAPFHDIGATTVTRSNTGSTDHVSFDGIGIPGFQFIQDQIEYSSRTHHSNQDNYDRLQAADMKQASTIMAAFVWNAANMNDRFPRKPESPTTAPTTAPAPRTASADR